MRKIVLSLLAACALLAYGQEGWSPKGDKIKTQWAESLDPANVLPEYPRPGLTRGEWMNLNGEWDYAIRAKGEAEPVAYDGKILVPFAVESSLSGVQKEVGAEKELWYKRSFTVPSGWKGRTVLLHFGAVDWRAEVFVNDVLIGSHQGGYTPFTFDVTPYLNRSGKQELTVRVWDPSDKGFQPRGKQVANPEGIWYTPVTGIWQTVWLEPVATTHITAVKSIPDIDNEVMNVTVSTSCVEPGTVVTVELLDQGKNRSAAGPSPDIMSLRGLRIAFASETDEGQRFSPARVKWFSGGETLTGRYPHDKRNVSFAPTHLLALLTNHKPHAPASDFAFWERLLLVDFPLSFVDRKPQNENERPMDKGLKDRLLQELPGIAAWLVRGCLEWQRVGIAPPAKVREATSEYRRDEDLLADFVDECCDLQQEGQPEIRSKASDLYDAFCAWFKRNVSAKKSISQKAFGKMMLERFQRERKGGTYYYFGVSVSPHAQLELDQEE